MSLSTLIYHVKKGNPATDGVNIILSAKLFAAMVLSCRGPAYMPSRSCALKKKQLFASSSHSRQERTGSCHFRCTLPKRRPGKRGFGDAPLLYTTPNGHVKRGTPTQAAWTMSYRRTRWALPSAGQAGEADEADGAVGNNGPSMCRSSLSFGCGDGAGRRDHGHDRAP